MAQVKFAIWERGNVDVQQLELLLKSALKYSVCDIVMEYRLLTCPICEPPVHCERQFKSPMHSAPSSPIGLSGKEGKDTCS